MQRTLALLALAVATHAARPSSEAVEYSSNRGLHDLKNIVGRLDDLKSNIVATPSEELWNTATARLRAGQPFHPNRVVVEGDGDDGVVEADKPPASTLSQTRSKAHSKAKYFSFFFGTGCDASRRRRDDESIYKGDPDCSKFDCQNGMSRRRRSDDCSSTACLPALSTVQTERLGTVPITQVQVGDKVLTSEGYSEVLFFAMRNPIARGRCWKVSTANATIVLTHSHALFKADGTAVQVMHVDIGDELLSAGIVTGLMRTECTGLIAPVTRAGTLVVNGVVTSDYGPVSQMLGHRAAHALVLPLRAAKWAFPEWQFWKSIGKDGRHPIMAFGQYLVHLIHG